MNRDFKFDSVEPMQFESFIMKSTAIEYPYGNATLPAPILAPSNIPDYGSDWESGEAPEGITLDYSTSGDDAVFSASGSNSTIESGGNYYSEQSITINTFKIVYSLTTGLMKEINLDLSLVFNNTMENPMTGERQMNYIGVSIKFRMVYTGEEDINIGLVDNEKLGFKVTEFYLSPDLIDFLNATIANGTITEENVTQLTAYMENLRWTYTYRANNPYYPSGLDLYYDILIENPLAGTSDTGWDMFNVYQLGAPYVIPDWEIQYGVFQFQQHILLKIYPKIIKYAIENRNTNAFFNYDSSYNIYESPDGNWRSLMSNISVNFGFKQTITSKDELKSDITISLGSWITYSSDGKLTEIGLEISFTGKADTNENNDLTDEDTYSGTFRIVVNRVQNTAGPTSSPDFDNPLDAPEPTSSWKEVTPYKTVTGAGGEGGVLPETIAGIPTIYIIGGAIGLIILIGLVSLIRRR